MDIYRKVGMSEYGIVDWRKKQAEIYLILKEDKTSYAYLSKKVTENNKDDFRLVIFFKQKNTFDELLDIG